MYNIRVRNIYAREALHDQIALPCHVQDGRNGYAETELWGLILNHQTSDLGFTSQCSTTTRQPLQVSFNICFTIK